MTLSVFKDNFKLKFDRVMNFFRNKFGVTYAYSWMGPAYSIRTVRAASKTSKTTPLPADAAA